MSTVDIVEADLNRTQHQADVLAMVDAYARDPMGDSRPLGDRQRRELIAGLRDHPTTIVLLAYRDDRPVGVAVCFRGFSTFAARPLINIHDLAVVPEERGQGTGRRLLDAVADLARKVGCCKVTLEVQERNERARGLYEAVGFRQANGESPAGGSLFFTKALD